jgi:hypothetical protein
MEKQVIFFCGRYPELGITVVPFGAKNEMGHKIKAKHLQFGPCAKLGAGILYAKTEAEIEFIRNTEYFKRGLIIEITDENDIPKSVKVEKVVSGTHDTRDKSQAEDIPAGEERKVRASRIPKK